MSVWIEDFSVTGKHVSAVPLSLQHHDDLVEAAGDGELHRLWYTVVPKPENVGAEIERRVALHKEGAIFAFAIVEAASGKAVGMTTFMNIEADHKRLEIGATWCRQSVQKTPLNTECKLLLLQHAFEVLGCNCVEFRTHSMNVQSRRAIERLGAKLDGVLRSHMVMANGTVRDTAAYSIIACEWLAVKANLTWQLEKPRL